MEIFFDFVLDMCQTFVGSVANWQEKKTKKIHFISWVKIVKSLNAKIEIQTFNGFLRCYFQTMQGDP